MATYTYGHYFVVYDARTGLLSANRSDGRLLDHFGAEVEARDLNGIVVPLRTGPAGVIENFTAEISHGTAEFGTVRTTVFSDAAMDGADAARAAQTAAEAAAASVQWIADNATELSYLTRDPNGDVWVHEDPVLVGGGKPRIDPVTGDVTVFFPEDPGFP